MAPSRADLTLCLSGSLQPHPWEGRPRNVAHPFRRPEGAASFLYIGQCINKKCILEKAVENSLLVIIIRLMYLHGTKKNEKKHTHKKSTTYLAAVIVDCCITVMKHRPKPTCRGNGLLGFQSIAKAGAEAGTVSRTAYWLAPHGLHSLLSYTSQAYL